MSRAAARRYGARKPILQARNCGNRRLARMVTSLSLQTLRYSKLGLASRARRRQSLKLWREGLRAFERGDLERYLALTRQRIEESAGEAVRRLDTVRASGGAT